MTTFMYEYMVLEHTERAKEVTWKDLVDAMKEVRAYRHCLGRIFALKKDSRINVHWNFYSERSSPPNVKKRSTTIVTILGTTITTCPLGSTFLRLILLCNPGHNFQNTHFCSLYIDPLTQDSKILILVR